MTAALHVALWACIAFLVSAENCYPERFGNSSVVCKCDLSSCGDIGTVEPTNGKVTVFQSTLDGERFAKAALELTSEKVSTEVDLDVLVLNRTLQEIIGFGGAFTDSAAITWSALDKRLQARLINAYFGKEGLEYNMGRIPMAGCDFSTRDYTYADNEGDFELNSFALAAEDLDYKIPMIKAAQNVSAAQIYFFGSPWSAPAWMKTNKKTYGLGGLIGQPGGPYYKTWAQYFVKFYQAYQEKGITMWGFTLQNEPTTGFIPWKWQTMAMSPYTQRDFLKNDLGPAIFKATNNSIKLMFLDDSRIVLPWWANVVLGDAEANQYAAGVAVHWYHDSFRSASALTSTHNNFPDKFIINTEACAGAFPFAASVILGSWERAEQYAYDIIDDLRNYVSSWVDWNLCLGKDGGPNWVKNFVDSPIIVDSALQTFYKQPMYYAMGHFTKFLPRGTFRLEDQIDKSDDKLSVVNFVRPDGLHVAIVLNQYPESKRVQFQDSNGMTFVIHAAPRSISSALW